MSYRAEEIREIEKRATDIRANILEMIPPGKVGPTRGAYLRDRIAMRRPGRPEELLGIVALLASDASSYNAGGSSYNPPIPGRSQ